MGSTAAGDLQEQNKQVKPSRRMVAKKQVGTHSLSYTEQLSTLSHVSTKHIANIEKGKMNPSFEILLALSKVLKLSLDSLIFPNMSEEDAACKQLAISYKSCPPAMRRTLLNSTRTLANELAALESHIEK